MSALHGQFLPYCGLRIGEALGLRWCDVNLDAGLLHVRQQLSRRRVPKQLKTPAAQREVVLAPALVTLLREHWLAAPHKAPGDLVFCKALGRGVVPQFDSPPPVTARRSRA